MQIPSGSMLLYFLIRLLQMYIKRFSKRCFLLLVDTAIDLVSASQCVKRSGRARRPAVKTLSKTVKVKRLGSLTFLEHPGRRIISAGIVEDDKSH